MPYATLFGPSIQHQSRGGADRLKLLLQLLTVTVGRGVPGRAYFECEPEGFRERTSRFVYKLEPIPVEQSGDSNKLSFAYRYRPGMPRSPLNWSTLSMVRGTVEQRASSEDGFRK